MDRNEERTSRAVALAALLLVGSVVAVAAPAASHVEYYWGSECEYEYTVDTPKVHRHDHTCPQEEADASAVSGAAERIEVMELEQAVL